MIPIFRVVRRWIREYQLERKQEIITNGYVTYSSSVLTVSGILVPNKSRTAEFLPEDSTRFPEYAEFYAHPNIEIRVGDIINDWTVVEKIDCSEISDFVKYVLRRG